MTMINSPFGRFNVYDDDKDIIKLITDAERVDGFDRSHLKSASPEYRHEGPYSGRNYNEHPYGDLPWNNFNLPVIPRSEWPELIKEGNKRETFGIHHHKKNRVPILDQMRTNYCWMNGVVGCIMNTRVKVGLPNINLSSASAAAPGKNYQNVGGWGGEAIEYINRFGLAPHSRWPNAAIERRYFQPTREIATHFGVGDWLELRPRNFDQVMTCLLMGWEVAVGYMWWGHLIYLNAPVQIGSNAFGAVGVNSWGPQWENEGMTVLAERKATPDDANAITTVKMDGFVE